MRIQCRAGSLEELINEIQNIQKLENDSTISSTEVNIILIFLIMQKFPPGFKQFFYSYDIIVCMNKLFHISRTPPLSAVGASKSKNRLLFLVQNI